MFYIRIFYSYKKKHSFAPSPVSLLPVDTMQAAKSVRLLRLSAKRSATVARTEDFLLASGHQDTGLPGRPRTLLLSP